MQTSDCAIRYIVYLYHLQYPILFYYSFDGRKYINSFLPARKILDYTTDFSFKISHKIRHLKMFHIHHTSADSRYYIVVVTLCLVTITSSC